MNSYLHVKISTWYTELKIQTSLTKPRWNLNPDKNFKFFIQSTFFPISNENLIPSTREFLVYFFKKIWRLHQHVLVRWQTYQSHKMFTRIQKFHGILKLRLKRWQSQIIWKYEKRSSKKYMKMNQRRLVLLQWIKIHYKDLDDVNEID